MKKFLNLIFLCLTITSSFVFVNAQGDWAISFDSNGGNGEVERIEAQKNQQVTLPDDPYYKRGYAFRGWRFKDRVPGYAYTINYVSASNGTKLHEPTVVRGLPNSSKTVSAKDKNGYTTPNPVQITFSSQAGSHTFKYNPIKYNISYNLNGGTISGNPTEYTVETPTFTLKNPSKTGSSFTGWTGSNGSTPQTNVSVNNGSTGSKNYTANWSVNNYTYNIVYKSSTGKNLGTSTVSGDFGSTKTVTAPAKNGYDTPAAQNVKFDSTSAKTITFTYPIKNYTISYNLNGGSASGNPTSYNVESPNITLKNPTRSGYTFASWSGTGLSQNSSTVIIPTGSTGNRSYTANWNTNSYILTFNANGGSVNPSYKTLSYGAQYGNLPTPTRSGYKFLGWFTQPSGGTQVYSTNTMGSNNTTIYAHWEVSEFTITWDANGGSVTPSSSKHEAGKPIGILPTPTRSGHTFDGWYTAANGGSRVYDNQSMPFSNVTYFAHWTAANYTYTIKYLSDSGINLGSTTISGNAGSTQTVSAPQKTGYTTPSSKQVTFDTPSKTIEFRYTPVTYWINYYLDGGTSDRYNPGTYNIESSSITLQQPTKQGYEFTGWTGSNGNTPQKTVVIKKGTTGNLDYTANWKKTISTVTVTYQPGRGTGTPFTQTVEVGKEWRISGDIGDFKKDGYYIESWNDSFYGTGEIYPLNTLASPITQDLTLYATWVTAPAKPLIFTVTLSANPSYAGTVSGANTYQQGAEVIISATPKQGYKFLGWTNESGDLVSQQNPYKFNIYSNVTYKAEFTQDTVASNHKVTYHANDNAGNATSSQTIPNGSTWQTLGSDIFTRSGYTFKEWNTRADGKGTTYNPSSTQGALYSSLDLYAIWTENTSSQVTITYHSNRGYSDTYVTQNVSVPSSITIKPSNTFTNNGYTLKKWCTNQYGNGTCYTPGSTVHWNSSINTTLYAYWELNTPSYNTVYYYPNGGDGNTYEQQVNKGSSWYVQNDRDVNFSRPNCRFKGWNTRSDGSGTPYTPDAYKSSLDNNLYLYAQWDCSVQTPKYTLTLKASPSQGGYVDGGGTYDAGTTVTIRATPTWDYEFVRWSDGSIKTERQYPVNGNTELIAYFSYKQQVSDYTVYYHSNIPNNETTKSHTVAPNEGWYTFDGSQFSRSGYKLTSWNTNPYGTGTRYELFERRNAITQDLHLYAQWEKSTPNYYTVTYNSNGYGDAQIQTVQAGVSWRTEGQIFSRPGWKILSWNTDPSGEGGSRYELNTTYYNLNNNLTLYPKWGSDQKAIKVYHERMSVDGQRYELFETDTVYANSGDTIRPQVKTYEGFTSPQQQSLVVSNADGQSITYIYERNKYGLNLDLMVDGKENNGAGFGDLYVGNTLFKGHINDYYHNDDTLREFYYGSTVTFKNITAKSGYALAGPNEVSIIIGADTWANTLVVNYHSSWVVEKNSPINMTKPSIDTRGQYIEANYYPGEKEVIPHKIEFQYWWAGSGYEESQFIVEFIYKGETQLKEVFRGGGYVRDRPYTITIPEHFRTKSVSRVKAFIKFPNTHEIAKNYDRIKITEYSIKK